jgi:hypothetical protein
MIMQLRTYASILLMLMLLTACGKSDTNNPSAQSASSEIADLLRRHYALGTTVEVDAYHWLPYRGRMYATYERDDKGCPNLTTGSLLADRPVPSFLTFLNTGMSNWSSQYPPDDKAWLIPMPADEPTQTYPAPKNAPTQSQFPPPSHARLRGRLGDPALAHCPHADRIFVVESVVTVYEQSAQVGPSIGDQIKPLPDFASWPRYHDAAFGYSIAYPADWKVEPLREAEDSGIMLRGTQWPNHPIVVRIYAGETHVDQYQSESIASIPRLAGDDVSLFNQEYIRIQGGVENQHLDGYVVQHDGVASETNRVSVLLSAQDHTYELTLDYPIGLEAQPALLDAFSLMVAGFGFDVLPGPSPTPPVKQQLGSGPFMSQDAIMAQLRAKHGDSVRLLEAQLVPEAEARKLEYNCYTFQGHPDGVWLLKVEGLFTSTRAAYILFDAATGTQLCGAEVMLTPAPPNIAPAPVASPTLTQ